MGFSEIGRNIENKIGDIASEQICKHLKIDKEQVKCNSEDITKFYSSLHDLIENYNPENKRENGVKKALEIVEFQAACYVLNQIGYDTNNMNNSEIKKLFPSKLDNHKFKFMDFFNLRKNILEMYANAGLIDQNYSK